MAIRLPTNNARSATLQPVAQSRGPQISHRPPRNPERRLLPPREHIQVADLGDKAGVTFGSFRAASFAPLSLVGLTTTATTLLSRTLPTAGPGSSPRRQRSGWKPGSEYYPRCCHIKSAPARRDRRVYAFATSICSAAWMYPYGLVILFTLIISRIVVTLGLVREKAYF